ncbi:glycosyltransferase family 1 protein [Chitinophaga sp. Cy-1792]|uniref:glycosyltransferase family 4 protein n=1 Tax=Chitinophaga sp. Cy-1792 TaxID=2608339 RepID=UPI00141E15BF|nr:glycosyltransferase family 1 protein [Chitinophaga sp. Cy-1792]NIG54437.1 glycosyltransferase family 4 protein [Chitinophaga sp. Cy-1792]
MNIYLDNIVFSIQQAGGVSAYWYELLKGICNSGQRVSFLNTRLTADNVFEQQLQYNDYPCIRESKLPAGLLRYLPLRYTLPAGAIYHAGYMRVSPQKNILNILTVHDFAHERKLATRFPRGLFNTTQKAYGIRKADGIICISESTRSELYHFYPQARAASVSVIHHGIGSDFSVMDKRSWPSVLAKKNIPAYVLYVGARNYYKHFNTAVQALALLPENYHLVAVGGGATSATENALLKKLLPGRHHLLPVVSKETLNHLYNQAFCLLYPSVYEGFGFPPGEAMKAGCPVVACNRTSIPEVVGDAGILADEPLPEVFAFRIQELEQDSYRQRLISKGLARVQQFTWEKTVASTLHFYQNCWQKKFAR